MDPNSETNPPSVEDFDEHLFNTDLLLYERDRNLASRLYPEIYHILDFPRLRQVFAENNDEANAAKKRSRGMGVLAIGLGTVGLYGAASTPLWQGGHGLCPFLLSILWAACGVAGVLIGLFGVLHSKPKRHWLYRRMMTERLRQFHFQALLRGWREFVATCDPGNPEARREYLAGRDLAFDEFIDGIRGNADARLNALVSDDTDMLCWLHEKPESRDDGSDPPIPRALFKAYRRLRIQHQLDYCNHKLHNGGFAFKQTLREQAKWFGGAGLLLIFVLLGLQVGEAVHGAIKFGGHGEEAVSEVASEHGDEIKPETRGHHDAQAGDADNQEKKEEKDPIPLPILLSVISMWVAITGLALHTLADGLRVHAELDRYWEYRASLTHLARRFDSASSDEERFEVMEELEQVSFDEMRGFLHAHDSARFLI